MVHIGLTRSLLGVLAAIGVKIGKQQSIFFATRNVQRSERLMATQQVSETESRREIPPEKFGASIAASIPDANFKNVGPRSPVVREAPKTLFHDETSKGWLLKRVYPGMPVGAVTKIKFSKEDPVGHHYPVSYFSWVLWKGTP